MMVVDSNASTTGKPTPAPALAGNRSVIAKDSIRYPCMVLDACEPPELLYVVGDPSVLHDDCISIIGARRATPYGIACAKRFARLAAQRGLCVVSGGALGCDSAAHEGALEQGGKTIAVLGGGCDQLYPQRNQGLFQRIVDSGGAVVSENPWDAPPLPFTFRRRNRLIATLSNATLIVEAGLPSGTFTTADDALQANRDVMVVPGAITSPTSAGSNRLLYQGAIPVIDDDSFDDAISRIYYILPMKSDGMPVEAQGHASEDPLLEALRAQPMRINQIFESVETPALEGVRRDAWLHAHLAELEADKLVVRFPDGRYGAIA